MANGVVRFAIGNLRPGRGYALLVGDWAAMTMANAAADYPELPVLYIVPCASGGGPDVGAERLTSTPQELARYTREELQRWQRVIRESGARTD
jgi:tripartite-type tricarboxylate transporter receptor subunit TctC